MRPKWNATIENMYEDIESYIKSVVILEVVKVPQIAKIFNIVEYITVFTGDWFIRLVLLEGRAF